MLDLYVDADACPVKEEVFRVAERYALKSYVVTNLPMRDPEREGTEMVRVGTRFNEADDWIAEHAGEDDIVITGDIPLAARCLEKGARVLGNSGHPFTEDNIGSALASRELMSQLRDLDVVSGGPKPFEKKDRSRFLQKLDEMIQAVYKKERDREAGLFPKHL